MAATKLAFKADGNKYIAEYTSKGVATVEVERTMHGTLTVLAKLAGMEYVPVWATDSYGYAKQIVNVNFPIGVMVRIESASEVVNAKILHADA